MRLDESSEINIHVLRYLAKDRMGQPVIALPGTVRDPYYEQGSHPDVVERIWDQIGSALPADCRRLVYGSPALVHPMSGVIFVFSMGTAYCLRLSPKSFAEAIEAGAKTYTKWTGGGDMDTQRDLGPHWVFGGWLADEIRWCRTVYDELGGSSTSAS